MNSVSSLGFKYIVIDLEHSSNVANFGSLLSFLSNSHTKFSLCNNAQDVLEKISSQNSLDITKNMLSSVGPSEAKPAPFEQSLHSTPKVPVSSSGDTRAETVSNQSGLDDNDAFRKRQNEKSISPEPDETDSNTFKQQTEPDSLLQEDLSNHSSLNPIPHEQNYAEPSDFDFFDDGGDIVADSNRLEPGKSQDNLEKIGYSSESRVQSAERLDGTNSVTHDESPDIHQQMSVNNIRRSETIENSNSSTLTVSSVAMHSLKGSQTVSSTVKHHQRCDGTNMISTTPQNSEIDPNVTVTHRSRSNKSMNADFLSPVENPALLEKRTSELTPRMETVHPKDVNTSVQKSVLSAMELSKSAFHPVQKQSPKQNFAVPFHGNLMFNEFQPFTIPHQLFPVPQQAGVSPVHPNIAVRVADFTKQQPLPNAFAQTGQPMEDLQAAERLKMQQHQQRMRESMVQAERDRHFQQQINQENPQAIQSPIYSEVQKIPRLNREQLHVLGMVRHENINNPDVRAMLHQVQMPHAVIDYHLFHLRFIAEQNRLLPQGMTEKNYPGTSNLQPNQKKQAQQRVGRRSQPPQQFPIQLGEMHPPLNPNDPMVQAMMAQRALENQNQQQNRRTRAIRARPGVNEQMHPNAHDVQKNRQKRPDNRGSNPSEQMPQMPPNAYRVRVSNLEMRERSQRISRSLSPNGHSHARMMAQKRRSQAQSSHLRQLNAELGNTSAALENQESQSSRSSVTAAPINHFQQSVQQEVETRPNPAGMKGRRGQQQPRNLTDASNNPLSLDIQPLPLCKNEPFEPSLQPYFKDSMAFQHDRRGAEKPVQVSRHLHPFLRVDQHENPGNLHVSLINHPAPGEQRIQDSQSARSIQPREVQNREVVPRNQRGQSDNSESTFTSKHLQDPHQIARLAPSHLIPSTSKEASSQDQMIQDVNNAEQLPVMVHIEKPEDIQKKMDGKNSDSNERNDRIQFVPNSHYRIDTSPNQLEPSDKGIEDTSLISIEKEGWGEKRLKDFQNNFEKDYKERRSQENLLNKSQNNPEMNSSVFNSLEPEYNEFVSNESVQKRHPQADLNESERAAKEGIISLSTSITNNQIDPVSEVDKEKLNVEQNVVERNEDRSEFLRKMISESEAMMTEDEKREMNERKRKHRELMHKLSVVIQSSAGTQLATTQISCQSADSTQKSIKSGRRPSRVKKPKASHLKTESQKEFDFITISDSEGEEEYDRRYPNWSEKKLLEDVGLIEEIAEVEPQNPAETIKETLPEEPKNERHQRLLKRRMASSSELLKSVEKPVTETDSPLDSPSIQPQRPKRVRKDEVVQADNLKDAVIPSTYDQSAIELYDEGVLKKEFSRNRFPTEEEITCILAELKSKKCANQVRKWFADRRIQLGIKSKKGRRRGDE